MMNNPNNSHTSRTDKQLSHERCIAALKASIQENVEREKRAVAKERDELRDTPMCSMSRETLQNYAYAQLSDWPVLLTQEERVLLYNALIKSVEKMKGMSMTYAERKAFREKLERIKKAKEKALHKLLHPDLVVIDTHF